MTSIGPDWVANFACGFNGGKSRDPPGPLVTGTARDLREIGALVAASAIQRNPGDFVKVTHDAVPLAS